MNLKLPKWISPLFTPYDKKPPLYNNPVHNISKPRVHICWWTWSQAKWLYTYFMSRDQAYGSAISVICIQVHLLDKMCCKPGITGFR